MNFESEQYSICLEDLTCMKDKNVKPIFKKSFIWLYVPLEYLLWGWNNLVQFKKYLLSANGISCVEDNKVVFCYVNEVTSGPYPREGDNCQENQPPD